MVAIWVLLGMTEAAWSKVPPTQKRKARELAKRGFVGMAKIFAKKKPKKTAQRKAGKSKDSKVVAKAATRLSKKGFEVVSRYGKWNSKKQRWES